MLKTLLRGIINEKKTKHLFSNLEMRDEKAIITLREPFDRLVAVSDHSMYRRRWDSNPRYALTYTRFPSVLLKPLGHPSNVINTKSSQDLLQYKLNEETSKKIFKIFFIHPYCV